jgi:hypothetical protein
MPLYWLCYRLDHQISVVIEPGASIIHARMRASLDGLDEGEFTEGHELDRKWRVPKAMIGRSLSQTEAKRLLLGSGKPDQAALDQLATSTGSPKREPRPNRRRAGLSGTLIGTFRGARGAPGTSLPRLHYSHLTAVQWCNVRDTIEHRRALGATQSYILAMQSLVSGLALAS